MSARRLNAQCPGQREAATIVVVLVNCTRALEYKVLLCDRKINHKISIMSYITIGSIAERVSCFVFMLVLATQLYVYFQDSREVSRFPHRVCTIRAF
jgi:hypothetical protein